MTRKPVHCVAAALCLVGTLVSVTRAALGKTAPEMIREPGVLGGLIVHVGAVSAVHFDGRHLPYAENLVNLLIVHDAKGTSPADREILRVPVPRDVVYVRGEGGPDRRRWHRFATHRPWPGRLLHHGRGPVALLAAARRRLDPNVGARET